MIRWNFIRAIVQKEILDVIRDKKTLLINLALPVVIWPVCTIIVTQWATAHVLRQSEKISQIALIGSPTSKLASRIRDDEKIRIVDLETSVDWDLKKLESLSRLRSQSRFHSAIDIADHSKTPRMFSEIERIIQNEEVDAVLAQSTKVNNTLNLTNVQIWLLYDSTNPDSLQAANRVDAIIESLADEAVLERLGNHGLTADFLEPLALSRQDVATRSKTVRDVVGRFLPLMLIVLVVFGGFYPAITMTAGEKEHGTLPTLLCAPIGHLEILTGKYIAILMITIIGVSANLISMGAVAVIGLAELPIRLSPMVFVWIFVSLIPVTMLYTALFISVAMFANSFREGQNLLSPVTLVAVIPAYSAMLPGVKLNAVTAVTPGFNIALLIKEILIAPVQTEYVLLTLISNLAWTFAILIFAAKVFQSEQVLLSGKKSFADIFTINRAASRIPDGRLSTVLFLIYLLGTFYLSGLLLRFGIEVLIPVLQIGLFVGVSLVIMRFFRMDIRRVCRLHTPRLSAVIGAVMIGLSIFLVTGAFSRLLPQPESYSKAYGEALQLTETSIPILTMVILIAVIPGVCEEFAFRGFMLSGYLTSLKPRYAITITGLWFACAHFSIYNFPGLLLMGLVLGFVAWESQSIWPAVVIHVLNNGLAVVFARLGQRIESWRPEVTSMIESPEAIVAGVMTTLAGLAVIRFGQR